MYSDIEEQIEKAFFISPIVDMEKLILGLMTVSGVSEDELRRKGTVKTGYGEDLSWEYLSFVREHPIKWNVPTEIIYGDRDTFSDFETVNLFSFNHNAHLSVMKGGEHWFHTEEQMSFIDERIKNDPVFL